ncbi:MAG: hypothetical protein WD380_03805, partial [Gaiellaceae bacterium]
MSRTRDLLAGLVNAQAGGFLARPPGLDGEPGLGEPGITGASRARTWDAVVSAHAPDLVGETVAFVVLPDGTIVVEQDLPDDSLAPLAEAVEVVLQAPYRAAALRNEGDVWSAVAEKIVIVDLPRLDGETVDMTVVDGVRTLTVDGVSTIRPLPALDALVEKRGDAVVHAERVDGDLFAVD